MEQEAIIRKLNWFYSLELQQVDLYRNQAETAANIYLTRVFQRIAEIEQGHVQNISAQLKRLGAQPTRLGEIAAPRAGRIIGWLTGQTLPGFVLRVDLLLENKAIKDYQDFILRCGDPELFEVLWSNMVDEDLHLAWLARELEKIRSKS